MNINFRELVQAVKIDVEKDLSDLKELEKFEFPAFTEITDFDPLNPLFAQKPRVIEEHFGLPSKGNQVIYIYFIKNELTKEQFDNLINGLKDFKKNDHDGYTQITTAKTNGIENFQVNKKNNVIYVGTSGSSASRLQQHVGHGSKGTATIMLRKWPGLSEGHLKIGFGYYNFQENVSPDLLKRLEFYISSQLNPLVGHNRRA